MLTLTTTKTKQLFSGYNKNNNNVNHNCKTEE